MKPIFYSRIRCYWINRIILTIILGVFSTWIHGPVTAHAYDVGSALTTVSSGHGDYTFYNFDFGGSGSSCPSSPSSSGVDNPVNLIFYQNASVVTLQSLFGYAGYNHTSASSLACADVKASGGNFTFAKDNYEKTAPGCVEPGEPALDTHVRYYGPYYDQYWHYFFIGTSHIDANDSCSDHYGQSFGYQEDAERNVQSALVNINRPCNQYPLYLSSDCVGGVYQNSQQMQNQQEYVSGTGETACGATLPLGFIIDPTHCMQSDGHATTVQVY